MANDEIVGSVYATEVEVPTLAGGQIAFAEDTRKWFKAEAAGGAHPDLATHDTLGLATQTELDDHEAAADPHTIYQRESEKGVANGYASLDAGGTIPDAEIPATIARDSELPDLAGHVAAADPHVGYQKESEKGAANGYASLGADSLVPQDQLGTGTQDGTKFLRDDGTWQTAPGAGGGDPKLDSWPIGSVFISVVSTSPATLLGGGTWSQIAAGRVLVGIDSGDTDFDVAEETGGAKTVTLDTTMMPAHTHVENAPSSASGGALKFGIDTNASGSQDSGLSTASTGGGAAHVNVQPYFVVYMWKRTA